MNNQEKRKFKDWFHQIENINDLKSIVYELYVNYNYKYQNITSIVRYNYREINITEIIEILRGFNIKRCGTGDNCKSPNGCIQSLENFANCQSTTDKKSHTCMFCENFNRNFRRADQTKKNHMLEFQKIREKDEQDEFLVDLYKSNYSYSDLSTISVRSIKDIISLLEKYNIKKCPRGIDCKSPYGHAQSQENFYDHSRKNDGKASVCMFCYQFDINFKNADQTKKNHMLEFQKIKEKGEQDEFLVNLYMKEKYTHQNLVAISLRDINDIISLLERHDIKKCPQCNIIQSRENFFKNKNTPDRFSDYCHICRQDYYLNNEETIKNYHKMHYLNNLEKINKQHKNYNNQPGKYNTYISKLEPFEEIRRDPNNLELIQVRCKYSKCNKWFNPTNLQIRSRVKSINGEKNSIGTECNFYCSQKCKNSCFLYDSKVSEIITHQRLRNSEYQPGDFKRMQAELRSYFLRIKNPGKCGLCGKEIDQKDLILHHKIPVSIDYTIEADHDNIIFICKNCHDKVHQKDGCSNSQLKNFFMENC